MGYCCTGSMSAADWAEIKKMCKNMQNLIDQKFRDLDSGSLQAIKDRLTALENALAAVETEQATQNGRLDVLEENAALVEITTKSVIPSRRRLRTN